jgi:hypothetical protein
MKPKLTNPEITTCESLPHEEVVTTPKIKSEEIREELYRIVDAFLTEAKDQNGNERSLNRLNEDRHLAVDRLLSIIKEREGKFQKNIESILSEKDMTDQWRVAEFTSLVALLKQTK